MHGEPLPIHTMDARVGLNFMYSEIVRLFGSQVRELLDDLMKTVDGVQSFEEVNNVDKEPDEMNDRTRELLKRGAEQGFKPPPGWSDSMDFGEMFGGD